MYLADAIGKVAVNTRLRKQLLLLKVAKNGSKILLHHGLHLLEIRLRHEFVRVHSLHLQRG